jgi:hypothetical protein
MASLNQLKIFLEFEPIVKLACENLDCKFNLARELPGPEIGACNLKQITINNRGCCQNFERYYQKEKK